ncbi:MAG: T9SS type A sorting domain-containing protein [candidate division Zixibacteria bacterium]|nr:T9SS type A sorting domain-containing protein [candidate division Zixibacteria bacterium]
MGGRFLKAGRFVLGAGWLWLFSTASGTDWPVKKVKVERPAPAAVPEFKSGVSQKNLLKLSRPSPLGLPYPRLGTTAATPETLKILALRVEFQQEVPDDPTTTGLGVFDRRTQTEFLAQEGHLVDPAPHTKKYFESHLQALDRFYQAVSNGKLKLIGEVWPPTDAAAYQLPVTQAYYGSGGPYADSGVIVQISRFFKDAIQLADVVSPEIHFKNYQSIVLFHAGSSRQDDIFFNSPNDFFTGFLFLGDSVLVDTGQSVVREGLVVPESPSQDNRIVGLNATLAHEFGHQLGLVDIYNTQTLVTQVGDFSMMDNNGADVAVELDFRPEGGRIVLASSLLPVYPDAWSRAFLGFLDTVVVTRGPANPSLFAAELQRSGTEVVKVPISEQEYFLLESRAVELDASPPALKIDSTTYVVLGPGRQVTIDSSVFTFEYDLLLPGSGILIWHVDEAVALLPGCADEQGNLFSNYSCNTVNVYPERRFLELKEADGFVDFGGNYYTGTFGFAEDMYWAPNNTALTPTSNPSSRSKFGGQTGISVTGIGPPDTLMSFSVSSDYLLAGWPQFTGLSSLDWPVIMGDLDRDTEEEILTFSGPFLLVWKQTGSKFIPNVIQGVKPAFDKEGTDRFFPLAVFGTTNPSFTPGGFNEFFTAGPAGGDLNGIGELEVVAGTGNGRIFAFNSFDEDGDPVGLADLLAGFPIDLDSSPVTAMLVGKIDTITSPVIFAGTSSGKGFLISGSGARRDSNQFQGSVIGAALDSSGNLFITTDRNDSVFVYRSIDTVPDWPKGFASDTISAPVLAESDSGLWLAFTTGDTTRDGAGKKKLYLKLYLLDGNRNMVSGFPVNLGAVDSVDLPRPIWSHSATTGQPVIVLAYNNQIAAYQTNGVLATDFPKSIDRQRVDSGAVPLLANRVLREAGKDLLCAVPTGNLYFPKTLEREASFILGTGAGIEAAPAVASNGKIFARDVDGFIYGYSVAGFGFDSLAWRQAGHDFAGTNFLPKTNLPGPGVGTLVAEKSFYNYPNPVLGGRTALRYRLSAPATASLTVYDMAGNRIKEPESLPAEVGNDNEYQLDCSGFAAGVYLCRLEVNASGKKEVVFCKVAVVK